VAAFAERLLVWFEGHGRHDLPWQQDPTPYRVWVSEIMLQQTQVSTVIDYYTRFMARFPTLNDLAAAERDEVLGLWSGLGYYARARNLHRAACALAAAGCRELPADFDALLALPGIGRSTAAAILSLAHGQRHPILDGNVKRVLARYHAIDRFTGESAVEKTLWAHAETHTPTQRVAEYTQAIMDLGATLCSKRQPRCDACPVAEDCEARACGLQASLPVPRPKRVRPRRTLTALVIVNTDGGVLLERRAEQGVWGGLFSFPELPDGDSAAAWCERRLGCRPAAVRECATIAHAFTHFDLELAPLRLELEHAPSAVMDRLDWLWYNPGTLGKVGIAAPIAAFLQSHFRDDERQTA
jgi:A/G-specific adenine glycosylase